MGPMDCEPAFWNGRNSDIHFPAPWTVDPGTKELCGVGDAVLADPQALEQFPVTNIHPAWLKLIDEWVPGRQNHIASTTSMDDGLAMNSWMAMPQVQAFEDALNSGTSSYAQKNKRKYEEVERDVAPRQVKFPRYEQRCHSDEDPGSRNADSQGRTSLATGVWQNASGAPNIASRHEINPGRSISQGELACRAAVAGSQTPGVAVNGVTLRLPLLKLPSDNHDTTVSGSHPQKILNETSNPKAVSQGQKADKPVRVFECWACIRGSRPKTFKTERSLQRHLNKTKTHNAPPVLRCSKCGVAVVREDAMRSHHKSCSGTAVPV